MKIRLSEKALEDRDYWKASNNQKIIRKINELTEAILANPYSGIGKPEQLKYQLSGKWSRRINSEHRYIYKIEDDTLFVFSLRGHY